MFDHVTIRVADRDASCRFYDTVLAPLGIVRTHETDEFVEWDDFGLAAATAAQPATTGLHVAFAAASPAGVDAFRRAGARLLRDPDGNSLEAVHHDRLPRGGNVDRLSIRVADLAGSAAFYDLVAPHAGFRRAGGGGDPPRVRYSAGNGSFSVVADGGQTRNLHVAFPGTNAQVDAFHAALTAAGYRSNGAPGERPQYHAGYYAAFVLDPDGTNVEIVAHNRD